MKPRQYINIGLSRYNLIEDMLAPFLKWPGGKRWLVSKYQHYLPKRYNRYLEPFFGGGSVFFWLKPSNSIISDVNPELINLILIMRDFPNELATELIKHQENHTDNYYYEIRDSIFEADIEKAARFLYLNRTCYNGMYRVNRNGEFNVPKGTKDSFLYDIEQFSNYSDLLRNSEILCSDFGNVIDRAAEGDLVFADPPYTIAHNQNSFNKYNEKLFTWEDQLRLLDSLSNARERGARILSTNANFDQLRNLYLDENFYVSVVKRHSSIAGNPKKRGDQEEIIISSEPIEED